MNNERIEDMLSQLIKMVGSIQSEQQNMKQDMQGMKQDTQGMKQDMQEVKKRLDQLELTSERRHKEVLKRFKSLEVDQDYIWEKTVRNERDLEKLKRQES